MNKDTYGFSTTLSMAQLAEVISQLLDIRLYLHHSPIIGPWYGSQDLDAISEAVRGGKKLEEAIETLEKEGKLDASGRTFNLELNDPGDPHYGGPQFPGGGDYILRVRADPNDLVEIEEKLRNPDLPFRLHKRQGH